ncbi:11054_t:CDS:1, partial [Dentiscutata erythropus]
DTAEQPDIQVFSLDIANSSENVANSNDTDEDYITIEPDDQNHDDSDDEQKLCKLTEPDYSSEDEEI